MFGHMMQGDKFTTIRDNWACYVRQLMQGDKITTNRHKWAFYVGDKNHNNQTN